MLSRILRIGLLFCVMLTYPRNRPRITLLKSTKAVHKIIDTKWITINYDIVTRLTWVSVVDQEERLKI